MNQPARLLQTLRKRVRGSLVGQRRARLLMSLIAATSANPAQAIDLAVIGGARFHLPAASLREIRFRHTLRQQYDFSCGSAALATLLSQHYSIPTTEQAIFEQMYRDGDQQKIRKEGFSLLDMKRYLATVGMQADGFQLPLDKLADAALPGIVLIADKGYHHFVVVKGLNAERVLLGDPSSGTRAMSRAAFDAIWPSKLLFVIHRYQGHAAFNGASDWRAAPSAPLAAALNQEALSNLTLPRIGPGDF